MFKHSTIRLLAVTSLLGLATLASAATYPDAPAPPKSDRGICGPTLSALRTRARAARLEGRIDLSAAIAAAPDLGIAGIVGTLAQMIVETELSHAAVSGRFDARITASVAGSDFDLEVCRDAIVGEALLANRMRVLFVVGDFDRDGVMDVAVSRTGSLTWSLDLGATPERAGATIAGGPPTPIEAAGPEPRPQSGHGYCALAVLADRRGPGTRTAAGIGRAGALVG